MMSARSTYICLPTRQTLLKGTLASPSIGTQNQKPTSSSPIPSGINATPKKPLRSLTAYHIFFQIEREYIIQTTAGEDADKSIHDNKVYLEDVPMRYKNIKLLPDWYAGPGKRKKRKHRKQHGKIGFLELSRVISTRWAQLADVDPETKTFVQQIAQQEIDEYYREVKEYKELTQDLLPAIAAKTASTRPKKKAKKSRRSDIPGMNIPSMNMEMQQRFISPRSEMVSSSYQAQAFDFIMPPTPVQLQNDIDYFLSRMNDKSQTLCSPSFGAESQELQRKREHSQRQDVYPLSFDPFLELPRHIDNTHIKKPYNSTNNDTAAKCTSPTAVEVDICDDEILQLWKSHN